ncbi:hypothetical protein ASPVEDRAFT_53889 [Aspergillus versicolor CBS 583.65]|uniref:Uncharacterized protein n=1 Tax=Aspergillus versicolor CBS 583.65 TaxID=1036611 RepID=A0A1L9PPQ9_ASPVE|nr:uncharacterized protein ASPVEDRAFT_53889 [Aspergillus versicolor CBS 583.65]OJJ03509.1 hypothetical protein ASPVEDRAFT_53889 [Aspergillus versicolor CBS 583.65]
MPSSRTPLRAPPRSNARSQFASTPRFLFSQRPVARQKRAADRDNILPKDDTGLPQESHRALTPARDPPSRRKEVIEDSGSDLDLDEDSHQRTDNGVSPRGTPVSPLPDTSELDAEIEALFGPTSNRPKRRRVSDLTAPATQRRKPYDTIETSPPESSSFATDPPSPSLPFRVTPQKTPRPPATPITGKSSARGHPRFLISSSSQAPPKPKFSLPRSPSPEQADNSNAIPTPFSPSSRTLRRRGRQRSSGPSYLPGSMAAEVRSWVLEMGTKREQQIQATLGRRNEEDSHSVNTNRYSLMLRISNVRQSALSSCGPLAFLQGQTMASPEDFDPGNNVTKNVLLIGFPRLRAGEMRTSSRVPGLEAGDVVGVLRGLVWELGVKSDTNHIPDHEQILRRESERSPGLGKWLVGMEWEVISPT